jgi:hypothetical protein
MKFHLERDKIMKRYQDAYNTAKILTELQRTVQY